MVVLFEDVSSTDQISAEKIAVKGLEDSDPHFRIGLHLLSRLSAAFCLF